MNRPANADRDDSDPVEPGCRATADRLQRVLDGERAFADLDADPHAATCAVCRDRIRAALLVLSCVAVAPAVPREFAASILSAVRFDRRAAVRRRAFAATAGLAIAASLALVIWLRGPTPQPPTAPNSDTAENPQPEAPPQLPAPPQPIRVSDQLALAADAFRESTRPITDPATGAPNVLGSLASTLTRAVLQPGTFKLDPARDTLAELPEAARVGFEPVTGTARKGFNRLMREVNAIQPGGAN